MTCAKLRQSNEPLPLEGQRDQQSEYDMKTSPATQNYVTRLLVRFVVCSPVSPRANLHATRAVICSQRIEWT